ncbi:MAG TPA: transcriptional regulator NrdR [Phycisphaerales bacterium]|nr:transcriptional regulator NrdR [Phycisphaerales bacterium]
MQCPFCNTDDDKVIDSRSSEGGRVIRRRRECLKCSRRFTTYERVEQTARLMVVKRDGRHEPFDRENILRGINAACGKRPIPEEAKQRVASELEEEISRDFDREVESREIGERVMARLRDLDEVAYVRFASEYYQFKSVEEIKQTLALLDQNVRDSRHQRSLFEAAGKRDRRPVRDEEG